MTRVLAVALSVVAVLGMVAPASAQAPAPKVTINGLVDFVTTAYQNWSGGGPAPAGFDVTDSRDKGWYSRERGVFTVTGEVGRSKGVLALEFDITNGAGSGAGGLSPAFPGTTASADLDGDVIPIAEAKWLYVEAPIWGPGSIMPFIPVSTVVRAGLQPARGHDYKVGILFSGDFPGVTLESTWAPNLTSTLTYAQISERKDQIIAPRDEDNWAILASVAFEVFKGLTVKPTYAFSYIRDGNCGAGNLGNAGKGGWNPNRACATTFDTNEVVRRHTLGGDVRWTAGPFTVQPTVYYQWGEADLKAGPPGPGAPTSSGTADISAWIIDTVAGFRTGPLNIEGRAMYTSGNKADEDIRSGEDMNFYQPINPAFAYMAGWTEIQTSGVDYATAMLVGASGLTLRESPSYDKYGRIFLALAADYSLTPALTLRGLVNASWTAEKVDTDSFFAGGAGTAGLTPGDGNGDERFIGTEVNLGLTYRFAPNVAFDLVGAYLFAGDALSHAGATAGASPRDADDVYKGVARVRFTF